MVKFHLAEAKKAKADGFKPVCLKAAKEAFAMARGIKKFREIQKKAKFWNDGVTYKTRWDGPLPEAELFTKVAAYGNEALTLFKDCGGTDDKTAEWEEFAFRIR